MVRGKKKEKQYAFLKAFWKKHTIDQAMTWTKKELNKHVEEFLKDFEKRQRNRDPRWNWPEDPSREI